MPDHNEEIEIDLAEVFGLIIHRLWVLILCSILAGVIGFVISFFFITPKYQSTTKIIVLNKQESSTITYSDLQLASQLTKDYEELITCRYVLEQVIEQCELTDTYEDLCSRVSVENTKDTRIIAIKVEDEDPETAQYIADNIRDVAAAHIQSVTDVAAVNVVDYANLPEKKSSPSIKKWIAVGAAIGLLIALAAIFIEYLLDDTIKSSEDVERYLGYTTLALIPVMQSSGKASRAKRGSFHNIPDVPIKVIDPDENILQQEPMAHTRAPKPEPPKDTGVATGSTVGTGLKLDSLQDVEINLDDLHLDEILGTHV